MRFVPGRRGQARQIPELRPAGCSWFAHIGDDGGRPEVYIVALRGPGGKFQVSTAGGLHPQWGPDGNRLYYVNPLVELMAVDLRLGPAIEIDLPEKLFDIRHPFAGSPFQIMPDGQSFLVSEFDKEIASANLTLVQNWPALLGR